MCVSVCIEAWTGVNFRAFSETLHLCGKFSGLLSCLILNEWSKYCVVLCWLCTCNDASYRNCFVFHYSTSILLFTWMENHTPSSHWPPPLMSLTFSLFRYDSFYLTPFLSLCGLINLMFSWCQLYFHSGMVNFKKESFQLSAACPCAVFYSRVLPKCFLCSCTH